ncbi:MAG: corrinoid ABC transporter substrate-binding protein [Methanosaeta sp. PtaU1.Bin060]|nr:MAG: corrinoid ABC transporter substrate-binding protein [Methanosaeta sp. PtaU1.Bin060]
MSKGILALITLALLIIGSAHAQGIVVPGDSNGDNIVSAEEVAAAEKLAKEGKLSADQLQEIKHIHEKYPIEITDSANNTISIYKPIKKLVIQHTTGYLPVFILGAQDKIVAVTTTAQEDYSWVPGMKDKPTVGGYKELDFEKIISAKPDVIFTSKERPDIKEKLEPGNISVVALKFAETAKFDQEFRTLSKLLEKSEKAEEFISWRDSYLDQIKGKTEEIDQKIRVFLGSGGSRSQTWSSNTIGSGIHDAVTMAGGHNIVSELPGVYSVTVDPEWVIEKDPEAIIVMGWGAGEEPSGLTGYDINSPDKAKQFIESLRDNEVLKNTSAARNDRIYVIDGSLMLGSTTSYLGAIYCAKWFYPELFKDMIPEQIHKEFIEKWIGASYKGVWAYPQAG